MPRHYYSPAVLALAVLMAGAAPGQSQTKVLVADSDRYRVQYADSTVSINDICPVLDRGLGTRKMPIYVNGRPVGFC